MKYGLLIIFSCLFQNTKVYCNQDTTYQSESLIIIKISDQTYSHISFLKVPRFGKVACNGLVCYDHKHAIVIDTPANDHASEELITWIQNDLNKNIYGVVATHFHEDCLGGLDVFHRQGVISFSGVKTQALAKSKDLPIPEISFEKKMQIQIGNEQLVLEYFGEGHTEDNIVAYFSKDKVLFGGCLIKSIGSGKGNLDDANTDAWPQTVRLVATKYSDTEIVVPGHGKIGDRQLLNFTQEMFNE